MTVNPGFGHQQFTLSMLSKVQRVRQLIDQIKPECDLEVDGGIDGRTAEMAIDAGANVLVIGSAVFADPEGITAGIDRLRKSINCQT